MVGGLALHACILCMAVSLVLDSDGWHYTPGLAWIWAGSWLSRLLGDLRSEAFLGIIQWHQLALYYHFPTEIGTDESDTAIPFMDRTLVITSQCWHSITQ
jgi:hypothetical protein